MATALQTAPEHKYEDADSETIDDVENVSIGIPEDLVLKVAAELSARQK